MSAFNPLDHIAPAPAPNATRCDGGGFYTSYETARQVAVLLSFAVLGVILGLIAIVAVLVRLLRQLDVVVCRLRAESLSEVRGGLLPDEAVDDPENRSGGGSKSKRTKRRPQKNGAAARYEDAEHDDDVEHRL